VSIRADPSRRILTDPSAREAGICGRKCKIPALTPNGAGVVKKFTGFAVVAFLIFFAVKAPDAAANATQAVWDFLVHVANGLAAFLHSLAGGSSGGGGSGGGGSGGGGYSGGGSGGK
jgi:uncharacterized membrane protein YgcG